VTATQTTSAALAAAITFAIQKKVLSNLRASLVFANRELAEDGTFDQGTDTLTFVNVPDLAINTTPLTEGTLSAVRVLTLGTVTVSCAQYGDAVAITDIAKVKSPIEIVDIGAERLGRQARESIDQIVRDVIAASGTVHYGSVDHTTRATLDATDLMVAGGVGSLRALRTKMKKAKVPTFSDGTYRLMVHPYVSYDIRSDANTGGFIDVHKYSQPEPLLAGEIGRIEGFRVIEVVNAPTVASTVTVYLSLALGALKGWGWGDLQTFRTYHIAPGGDHSDFLAQEELLGWKVMFGVAVLSNSYYFRVESAATAIA